VSSQSRFVCILLAGLLAGGAAHAADPAKPKTTAATAPAKGLNLKIGYIDANLLLQKSPQAMAASDEMNKKFDARQKDLKAEQDKIKGKMDQFKKNSAIMSPAEQQDEQNEIDDMQSDLGRKSAEFQDDVNAERNAQLNKLQQDIYKAVQEFAQANGYNLIAGENMLFYFDKSMDVTDQVMVQMQKDFKTESSKGGN
jgi:outer membrane protein